MWFTLLMFCLGSSSFMFPIFYGLYFLRLKYILSNTFREAMKEINHAAGNLT